MSDNPATPIYALEEIVESQSDAAKRLTSSLRTLEVVAGSSVMDKDLNTPPDPPVAGEAYIVGSSPTGVWATFAGKIAVPDAGQTTGWKIVTPAEGSNVRVKDEDIRYEHNGTAWNPVDAHQVLTDAATIAWDLELGASAEVTLTASRTMGAPTNPVAGKTYILLVKQDGVGSHTVTWNAVFKFAAGTAPTLSTGASKVDLIAFLSDGTDLLEVSRSLDVG